MIGTSDALKIARPFQAMFAVLVLGLAANSVNWYTTTPPPGLSRLDGASLATAGCALCILAVSTKLKNPRLTIHIINERSL